MRWKRELMQCVIMNLWASAKNLRMKNYHSTYKVTNHIFPQEWIANWPANHARIARHNRLS